MYLTQADRDRLCVALGGALGRKLIPVIEDAASRGNVTAIEVADPAGPETVTEPVDDKPVLGDVSGEIEPDEDE